MKLLAIVVAVVLAGCNQISSRDRTMIGESVVVRVCANDTIIFRHPSRGLWRYVSGHPAFFAEGTSVDKTCAGD